VAARPRRLFFFCCYEQGTNITGMNSGCGIRPIDSNMLPMRIALGCPRNELGLRVRVPVQLV